MTTITISLPDEQLRELNQAALQLQVSPEELVHISIEELLAQPTDAFRQAIDYVLNKNAELYKH